MQIFDFTYDPDDAMQRNAVTSFIGAHINFVIENGKVVGVKSDEETFSKFLKHYGRYVGTAEKGNRLAESLPGILTHKEGKRNS